MALSLDLSASQFGVPFAGAYFRISSISISRTRDPEVRHLVMIDVSGYATQPDNEDTREIDFRRYHVPYGVILAQAGASSGFLVQCYNWLAQQSDMAGSIPA
jgi:hypothetical protein